MFKVTVHSDSGCDLPVASLPLPTHLRDPHAPAAAPGPLRPGPEFLLVGAPWRGCEGHAGALQGSVCGPGRRAHRCAQNVTLQGLRATRPQEPGEELHPRTWADLRLDTQQSDFI